MRDGIIANGRDWDEIETAVNYNIEKYYLYEDE